MPFLIYLQDFHVEIHQLLILIINPRLKKQQKYISYKNSVKSIQLLLSVSNALNTKLQYLSALPSG